MISAVTRFVANEAQLASEDARQGPSAELGRVDLRLYVVDREARLARAWGQIAFTGIIEGPGLR